MYLIPSRSIGRQFLISPGDRSLSCSFVPAFAGRVHARAAIAAGRGILKSTGHQEKDGPWIPVGVGVHTGEAYIGTVGERGEVEDIAVLGDNVNVAARLAGLAAPGELLISEQTRLAAELDTSNMEPRRLSLKGKEQPIDAWVIKELVQV